MNLWLRDAGNAALQAFIGLLITLLPGILTAPNLDRAYALGVAALIASGVAALRILQTWIPTLALGHYFGSYGAIADAFIRTLISGTITLAIGVAFAPDLNTARALVVAGIGGVIVAAVRAVVALLTPGEAPAPDVGVGPRAAPITR